MKLFTEAEIKISIMSTLADYASIPSDSGQESKFYDHLKSTFSKNTRDWLEMRRGEKLYFAFYAPEPVLSGMCALNNREILQFFVVHLDRIEVGKVTYEDKGEILKGQLDDLIGIAILKLLSTKFEIPILFTTEEEPVRSAWQVKAVIDLLGGPEDPAVFPIGIDIDVYTNLKQFDDGRVDIRQADACATFTSELQREFIAVAKSNNIPYSKDSGWSYNEVGKMLQSTDARYTGAYLGIPLVNYHTANEETYWTCIYNIITLLSEYLQSKYNNNNNNKEKNSYAS